MAENNLAERIKAVEALLDVAIADASQKVTSGPDNPGVKRLSGGAMVVKSSAMFGADNWSVFFHDWKAQYEWVKTLLISRRFSDLNKLLDGKSVEQQKLAPEVIAHVREITGDLTAA